MGSTLIDGSAAAPAGVARRRGLLRAALGVAALAAVAAPGLPVALAQEATPAVASPVASPVATGPANTAIIVSATNAPRPVPGSDGMVHLDYDLLVTNAFAGAVTMSEIAVEAPDGSVLLRLAGDDLVAVTQPLLGGTPTDSIPASGTVAVVVDAVVPADQVPSAIHHRIAYDLAPGTPSAALIGSYVIDGPTLAVDPTPPVPIAPPLRGPGWFILNDCCHADSVHRFVRLVVDGERYIKPEMYAIDWVRLQDAQVFTSDGSQNDQWFAYGADVVAVAPGTVVGMRDGMPENEPGRTTTTLSTAIDYDGNHVVVDIGDGVYALFAHLLPGSVTVRVGDQVETGQVLGLLGNSGNSTGPHLHFGLIDGSDPSTANAVPFTIDAYTLAGVASMDPSTETITVAGPPTPQTETLPLDLTVGDFPE